MAYLQMSLVDDQTSTIKLLSCSLKLQRQDERLEDEELEEFLSSLCSLNLGSPLSLSLQVLFCFVL